MTVSVHVAGEDSTEPLLARIEATAAGRRVPDGPWAAPSSSVDRLRQAESEAAYQEVLLRLIREEGAVDPGTFSVPRGPGGVGTMKHLLRKVLWKTMRYQHDQLSRQYNDANALLVQALTFEHESTQRTCRDLEQRLARLEARSGEQGGRA